MFFSVAMDLTEEGEGLWQEPASFPVFDSHHTLNACDGGLGMQPELFSMWAAFRNLGTSLWLCNQFQLVGTGDEVAAQLKLWDKLLEQNGSSKRV